jgi:Cof subfamily protein (haloacid dehalogenase superfamily)
MSGGAAAGRKLVFFDVDGTLVGYEGGRTGIPDSTVDAIGRLHRNGHLAALATGRRFVMSTDVMRETGIRHAVLHTGAQIVVDGKSEYEKPIGPRLVKALCEGLTKGEASVMAFDGVDIFGWRLNADIKAYLDSQPAVAGHVRPLSEVGGHVLSMNCYVDRERVQAMLAAHPALSHSNDYTEILARGVSKGSGLRWLAKRLGVPIADTIAFGDGGNDFDLFRAAGLSVAMGNAGASVKAAADRVTGTVFQDGIATMLTSLGLI